MAELSAKLYHTIEEGNSNELQQLIEQGADVNQYYDDLSHVNSKSILHFACAKGWNDCVKILLENGASVNVMDKWRMTPIMYCTSTCNYDIIKMLVQKDPETINTQDTNGESALHIAIKSCTERAIQFLVEMGANVNLQNNNGFTPLMSLMFSKDMNNFFEVMKILMESGADVDLCDFRDRRTALHLAVITKKVDAVEFLLQMNSDPNHLDAAGKSPLINLLGYHGTTHVKDDVMTIAVLLIQSGAYMNLTEFKAEHCNPLIMASHVKCYELVRLFLESGADVNVTFPYTGVTPLFIAVKQNDINAVRELINWSCRMDVVGRCRIRGENYDDQEDFMLDPFELAIHQGFWDIVELMIKNGYNVSKITYLQDKHKNMPASLQFNPDMLEVLNHCASTPNSLYKSSCLVIFRAIKSNISNKLDLLPLPVSIKKYLKFHYLGIRDG